MAPSMPVKRISELVSEHDTRLWRMIQHHVDEARKEGLKIQLTGVPTSIINNKHKIVGAQPIKAFTGILDKITKSQN